MFFRSVLILLCFVVSVPAFAASGDTFFTWTDRNKERWESYTNVQPYLENAKHPHPSQWAGYGWYAEDWIAQSRSGLDLVQGFYDADIIRNQEVDEEGVPVLVVGPNFYRLSGLDKRRIATTVDTVYGVTRHHSNRVIVLKDWNTELPIGVYSEYGLQLQ